ncbi:MAG: hypothetical protein ACLQDY_13655 [Streptosporangiaceae bacterium]
MILPLFIAALIAGLALSLIAVIRAPASLPAPSHGDGRQRSPGDEGQQAPAGQPLPAAPPASLPASVEPVRMQIPAQAAEPSAVRKLGRRDYAPRHGSGPPWGPAPKPPGIA